MAGMTIDGWRECPWTGFDLETTGADPGADRVVTAALVAAEGERSWLADPGVPISPAAIAVHGVTGERARDEGRPAAQVCDEIARELERTWADGAIVVVYNAPFDLTLLAAELDRHGLRPLALGPVLDPLVVWRWAEPYRPGKKRMADACDRFGIVVDGRAHEAGADARAALAVMRALAGLPALGSAPADVAGIVAAQVDWHREWARSFAAWLTERGGDASGVDGTWPLRRG